MHEHAKNDSDRQARELQRRGHELSILNDVAQTLNASVDLRTLLERALEKELVRAAYAEAVREGYLWHEFGDSHLLFAPAA